MTISATLTGSGYLVEPITSEILGLPARMAAMEEMGEEFEALVPMLPIPATTAPPTTSTASAIGTVPGAGVPAKFARDDHTHKSSVNAARLAVVGAGGVVTWTFATPYANGQVPVCTASVETASNATQPYFCNVIGQPTNTAVQFLVFRGKTQTLGGTLLEIVGTVINLFDFAPEGTYIHCHARLPAA